MSLSVFAQMMLSRNKNRCVWHLSDLRMRRIEWKFQMSVSGRQCVCVCMGVHALPSIHNIYFIIHAISPIWCGAQWQRHQNHQFETIIFIIHSMWMSNVQCITKILDNNEKKSPPSDFNRLFSSLKLKVISRSFSSLLMFVRVDAPQIVRKSIPMESLTVLWHSILPNWLMMVVPNS